MISLSRAARVLGEGVSSDALVSGSVCMSSKAGPGSEGAGLGRAVGVRVASGTSESWLSVIASSVPGNTMPRLSCWYSTEPAKRACIVARVLNSALAASGSLSWSCAAMAAGVVVMLTAVSPVSQSCAPLLCMLVSVVARVGALASVVGLWWSCPQVRGALTA